MKQKVSFVVAIYNVGKYLSECIESIQRQTYKEIEIILVNDGSTDRCLHICNEYAQKDARIRVINQENQGANAARNNGLEAATGEWIYFVDGDDYVSDNICEELIDYMSSGNEIIIFSYSKVGPKGIKKISHTEHEIFLSGQDFVDLQLSTLNRLGNYRYNYKVLDSVSIWNKLYNRDFLLKNKLRFVDKMPKLQDMTFNLQVYECASRGIYVNKNGYYYRINNESVSNRYQQDIIHKFDVINQWLQDFCITRKDKRFIKAYYERIATHVRTCIVLYFCNKKNTKKYSERRKEFLQLCEREPYVTALKQITISAYAGLQERVLALALKFRLFGLCNVLCRIREKVLHIKC